MGRSVTEVELDDRGLLTLTTDLNGKKIILDFDPAEESDDWVWMISIERPVAVFGHDVKSLACSAAGNVAFHVQ
jgi:hypothetical protein